MKYKKNIISKRRMVQGLVGAALYVLIFYFHISLLYVLIAGSILGIVLGKVFCRWMCPMGFIMELLMGNKKGSEAGQMYQYHKLGCPIAWVGGLLNKFSLVGIKHDPESCTSCGVCDSSCYISSLNENFSLYKADKKASGNSFSCSRCLECVSTCPKGSLKYSFLPYRKVKK
ncbi:MAG: 4Fe-4S binding protein [Spirochaetales bacterium]|nr:4Fe-4S binding protein [Spirochaetales bacterium]